LRPCYSMYHFSAWSYTMSWIIILAVLQSPVPFF
jgi:hypothetical protein